MSDLKDYWTCFCYLLSPKEVNLYMLHAVKKDIVNIRKAVFNIENVEMPNKVPETVLPINRPCWSTLQPIRNHCTWTLYPIGTLQQISGPCRSKVQASGILKHVVIHYHLENERDIQIPPFVFKYFPQVSNVVTYILRSIGKQIVFTKKNIFMGSHNGGQH